MKILSIFSRGYMNFVGLIIGLALSHWVIFNVYNYFCNDFSLFGVFKNFFMMGSPVCQFFNTIQYEISRQYVNIWLAGAAVIAWTVARLNLNVFFYEFSSFSFSLSLVLFFFLLV